MKIVYCADTVYQLGGVEITTVVKANALAEIPGNKVWIVVANNKKSSLVRLERVSLADLAVYYYEEDWKGYWHAIIDNFKKRRLHRKRLMALLDDIQPDIVISVGSLSKFFIPKMKISSNPVFIRELHTEKYYTRRESTTFFRMLIRRIGEWYDYGWKIREYDKIVVLTEADKTGSWTNWDKVVVMPNPKTKEPTQWASGDAKMAVSVGRLELLKGFDSLIRIWSKVVRRHPEWTLQIWGDGGEKKHLQEQIEQMGLKEHVFLNGYTADVLDEMSRASLSLISSQSEGFSLVALEAMSVGIPTVAYNCPGGIRYVVKDGATGFLVPLNDEDAFVEKVCTLIENDELRKTMGHTALDVSKQYGVEVIAQRWMELFQELLDKKQKKQII